MERLNCFIAVRVCRVCARVVEETGGVKYKEPKQEMQKWGTQTSFTWIPQCNKKDFVWAPSANNYAGRKFDYFVAVGRVTPN
jgi:hypothetical protein